MSSTTITLELPENLYLRLQQTARATRQSLDAVLMRALQVGESPHLGDRAGRVPGRPGRPGSPGRCSAMAHCS